MLNKAIMIVCRDKKEKVGVELYMYAILCPWAMYVKTILLN